MQQVASQQPGSPEGGDRPEFDARQQRIAALTQSLVAKRKRAVEWRQQIGIENEWADCEDAYEGLDDANRDQESPVRATMAKPRDPSGGAIGNKPKSTTRSTVFLNITRPYVDGAAARVADILMPTDDRNFEIEPTPIPEMAGQPPPGAEALSPEQIEQWRKAMADKAELRAKAAQKRIDDWLTECVYQAETRRIIEDCARLGSGIIKGPVPAKKRKNVVMQADDGLAMVMKDSLVPESRAISPWDLFPDPSCGERLDNGDRLSARLVRDLRGQPGYLDDELMACLVEGPDRKNQGSDTRYTADDDSYEIWYFTGEITELDFNNVYGKKGDAAAQSIKVVVSLINDRIVKIARVAVECEGFGYDLIPWQRRTGMPWGLGIGKQINVPQRMLNACTRNMSDNLALSCAPQIVMMSGVVKPADNVLELVPRKIWFADPETSIDDIRKAFIAIDIPTRQTELMNVIQFALKMAEEVTGLPLLMQGSRGTAPDTVGGMEILNDNANTILRRIARSFDDNITGPHIRRYYAWIMAYGEENEKGDFSIRARGSAALVERDIQRRAILSMGAVVTDPRYQLDPALWAEEALRANRIDPKRLKLSDKRKAELQQQAEMQRAAEEAALARVEAVKQADREAKLAIAQSKNQTDVIVAEGKNATALAVAEQRRPVAAGARW
jgi:hypothetical protein